LKRGVRGYEIGPQKLHEVVSSNSMVCTKEIVNNVMDPYQQLQTKHYGPVPWISNVIGME